MRSALFVSTCTLVALPLFLFVQDAVCEPVFTTEDAWSQSALPLDRSINNWYTEEAHITEEEAQDIKTCIATSSNSAQIGPVTASQDSRNKVSHSQTVPKTARKTTKTAKTSLYVSPKMATKVPVTTSQDSRSKVSDSQTVANDMPTEEQDKQDKLADEKVDKQEAAQPTLTEEEHPYAEPREKDDNGISDAMMMEAISDFKVLALTMSKIGPSENWAIGVVHELIDSLADIRTKLGGVWPEAFVNAGALSIEKTLQKKLHSYQYLKEQSDALEERTRNAQICSSEFSADGAVPVEEALKTLKHCGFVIVKNAWSANLIEKFLAATTTLSESSDHADMYKSLTASNLRAGRSETVIPFVAPFDQLAASLVHQPWLKALSSAYFGTPVALDMFAMISSPDGVGAQELHRDVQEPGSLTAHIPMQDLNELFGAMEFQPSTHITSTGEKPGMHIDGPFVKTVVPQGTFVLYDSSVVHRGTANSNGHTRHALMVSFTQRGSEAQGEGADRIKKAKQQGKGASVNHIKEYRDALNPTLA